MLCMKQKLYYMLIGISIVFWINPLHASDDKKNDSQIISEKIENNFGPKVNPLLNWPEDDVISSKNLVDGSENKHVKRAKRSSLRWINRVIKKEWLPEDPNYLNENLIMIQNEHGSIDTARIRWTKNNYLVQIGQTKTIIAIKITPTKDEDIKVEKTAEYKKNLSKNMCSTIINDEVEIEEIKPTSSKIIKKNIKERLISVSFDHARIQEYQDFVIGLSKTEDYNDISDRSDYNYWWRRLNWFTDGKFVGLCTLKTNGGAWLANYNSALDETWYEGSKYTKKSEK